MINPVSGGGRALRAWARARPEIVRRGLQFSEYFTTAPGDATRAARQALRTGVHQVVAVGGDGTLNEVVNGYLTPGGQSLNPESRLAILAAGTGSDFRKSLYPAAPHDGSRHGRPGLAGKAAGLDDIHKAIRAITGDESRLIDAGSVDCHDRRGAPVARFFINVVSFGLGGDVSRLVNGWRGRLPTWIGGRARFVAAAVGALAHYQTRTVLVRADDSEVSVETNLLVIANGRFAGGGMLLAPHAQVDDGLFDVIVTDRASRLDVVKELPRIRRGGYLSNPKVSAVRAASVCLATEQPVPLDIDGESGDYAPARFRVLPSVVRIAYRDESKQ